MASGKIAVLALALVVLSLEVEARRKILRGRKTITRTYYRGLEIPGWLTVILVSMLILIVNAFVFFILKKFIIQKNKPQPVAPYRLEHEV